jgi:hypothetical protein
VKKLLILIVMLVAGMALFAMPIAGEPLGVISTIDTVEAVQQLGVFATVTDVFPAFVQIESVSFYTNFVVSAVNDYPYAVFASYRQEVNSLLGYSKTAGQKMFDNQLAFDGWT